MVQKGYTIYTNATAGIRQDGMLGTKFLELSPGDATHLALQPGDSVAQSQGDSGSMDTMMQQMGRIVADVREVSSYMQQVVSNQDYTHRLGMAVSALQETAENMASFVQRLDELVSHNREHIVQTLDQVHGVSEALNADVPHMIQQAQSSLDQLSGYAAHYR